MLTGTALVWRKRARNGFFILSSALKKPPHVGSYFISGVLPQQPLELPRGFLNPVVAGHRACTKRALMKIPSLEDYEKAVGTIHV